MKGDCKYLDEYYELVGIEHKYCALHCCDCKGYEECEDYEEREG